MALRALMFFFRFLLREALIRTSMYLPLSLQQCTFPDFNVLGRDIAKGTQSLQVSVLVSAHRPVAENPHSQLKALCRSWAIEANLANSSDERSRYGIPRASKSPAIVVGNVFQPLGGGGRLKIPEKNSVAILRLTRHAGRIGGAAQPCSVALNETRSTLWYWMSPTWPFQSFWGIGYPPAAVLFCADSSAAKSLATVAISSAKLRARFRNT